MIKNNKDNKDNNNYYYDNDDPLFRPDNNNKFFNGPIDLYNKSMKEHINEILVNNYVYPNNIICANDINKISIEILKLFHDYIQTYREEYKDDILTAKSKRTKEKYTDKDLSLMRLQQDLRDFRHGSFNF